MPGFITVRLFNLTIMNTNSYDQPKQSFTFSAYKLILRHASWKAICENVNFLGTNKIGIVCILCAPRPTYRSTYQLTVDRRIGRHIGRVSTNMSVDISVEWRSICGPRCAAQYIGRHIDRASVDMSTDTGPICRSICVDREWLSDYRLTC